MKRIITYTIDYLNSPSGHRTSNNSYSNNYMIYDFIFLKYS